MWSWARTKIQMPYPRAKAIDQIPALDALLSPTRPANLTLIGALALCFPLLLSSMPEMFSNVFVKNH